MSEIKLADTEDTLTFVIGLIGFLIAFTANFSQVYHNTKYKTVNGISIIWISCMVIISVIFTIYGIYLRLLLITLLNLSYLTSSLVMIYYWKYGIKPITISTQTQMSDLDNDDRVILSIDDEIEMTDIINNDNHDCEVILSINDETENMV